MAVWDAAERYTEDGTPLMILAGKEYGTGSSRDWAAKGVQLQGVKAVIAESFERIHRSNLVGMGVLPLQFAAGQNVKSLGLSGFETFDIIGLSEEMFPGEEYTVRATDNGGRVTEFKAISRIDTPVEINYYKNGGILHTRDPPPCPFFHPALPIQIGMVHRPRIARTLYQFESSIHPTRRSRDPLRASPMGSAVFVKLL